MRLAQNVSFCCTLDQINTGSMSRRKHKNVTVHKLLTGSVQLTEDSTVIFQTLLYMF